MTPKKLPKIGFTFQNHKRALWWLRVLYLRPGLFAEKLQKLSKKRAIVIGFIHILHSLPYIVLLSLFGRLFLFICGVIEIPEEIIGIQKYFYYQFEGIVFGIIGAIVFGIFSSIFIGIFSGFVAGIVVGIVIEIVGGIIGGIVFGVFGTIISGISITIFSAIFAGIFAGIVVGIVVGILDGVGGQMYGAIVGGILVGLIGAIIGIISSVINDQMQDKIVAATFVGLVGAGFLSMTGAIGRAIIFGIFLGINYGILVVIGVVLGDAMIIGLGDAIIVGISDTIYETFPFGVLVGLFAGLAFITFYSRGYYYPMTLMLVWPKPLSRWYQFHPVAWDALCKWPFPGLEHLLVAYTEYAGKIGQVEIDRIILRYPSQRQPALCAKTILLAKEAGRQKDLSQLERVVTKLPTIEKQFLNETQELREMICEISDLQTQLNTMPRPVFREPIAHMLCTQIENFQHRIDRFHEPLASNFRKSANNWLKIAQKQLAGIQAICAKKGAPRVFHAGDPVDRNNMAFVPRFGVMGDLDNQIVLSLGCPSLVLYARRRMGKSTILRNMSGFLSANVIRVLISMQDPKFFTSQKDCLLNIVKSISYACSDDEAPSKLPESLQDFISILSDYNRLLEDKDKRLVISLDEYEKIDMKIGQGVFTEDLLATIRESIQSHRNITWIFAGSNEISELQNARWSSYLVSARTIEVPMFSMSETRLLLTEPLKYSTLWGENDPKRPHFALDFWGDGGIERVHNEAGGWPHLVQLIAEIIVELMNDEDSINVEAALLERALDKAIVKGNNVFYDLVRRECTLPGEWEYISAYRSKESQPPPDDEAIYSSIRRRLFDKKRKQGVAASGAIDEKMA